MTQFNMIEAPQGPDPKRLLLAVVVTSAVLMIYSYFFAPETKQITKETPTAPAVAAREEPPVITAPSQAEPGHPLATASDAPVVHKSFSVLEPANDRTLERTSYKAQISSEGGLISEFVLTGFSQEKFLWDQKNTGSALLNLYSSNKLVSLNQHAVYEVVSSDNFDLLLRHITPEGLSIERSYEFLDRARIHEHIVFKNLSDAPIKAELILSAVKMGEKNAEPGLMNPGVQGETIAVKHGGKYERFNYSDLTDTTKSFTDIQYFAFDDQYFLSAVIAEQQNFDKVQASVKNLDDKRQEAKIELFLKTLILVPNEVSTFSHKFFLGPKQVDLLASLNPPLDENVDFGWFGVLSRPMLWLLVQIYNFVHNYGLAIILITFIIKLLTYPLTQKSFSSQQAMKELQPKIKELQAKYSHDRALLGQKQMELYRAEGINPLAGCLPMLIQLPIWFAFFQMLRSSVELYDQPFYWWITDLTKPDQYYILPVLMGLSMLVQQFFTPTPPDQPQMKYVMWFMPIFLTFIMLNMPCGLSLYILTNNLLTILQQIIIKKQAVVKQGTR
jgi:YidC/Oxa1 family membrane protein insertase